MSKDAQQSPVEPLLLISNFFFIHINNAIKYLLSLAVEKKTIHYTDILFVSQKCVLAYNILVWTENTPSKAKSEF